MKRKVLKIIIYVFGSLVLLLTAFHFWFINHAEDLLEELVASRSNGKLKLEVKHFRFNWFSNHMQLRQAVFYSTDTATAPSAYRFGAERINLSVREILPLVFEKRVIIDSLTLINSDIQVTRLRLSKDTEETDENKGASLPHEMGRVYRSIQDALKVLRVTQFHIDNGKFTLINRIRPDDLPVTITNIQLHLDNLHIDTTDSGSEQKILFSDNVSLQTHNQDILFPDGRHKLSFGNFRINIQKKMVEFDSCTIAASKGDSVRTSFRIFFDKLRMTNIDFDTLYLKEIIKADSVYCINPRFRLDAELQKKTGASKPPPRLNELVQQLTGDLQVEFVAVQNGSFDINTIRDGRPNSFISSNNNFEIQGLRIRKNSPSPLTVKSLAMAIRNYENFLRDSTYALAFDSVLLVNNSIHLSNFTVKQMQQDDVINSFSMRQFQLRKFSWDDLVFEGKLAAGQATLYHPVIHYSFPAGQGKQQNVFQALAGIGEIIQLNKLGVTDGRINLYFNGGTQLQLENASFSLSGKELVQSRHFSSLKNSIRDIRFRKGMLRSGNLAVEMEDAFISGKEGRLIAASIRITDKEKNFVADAKEVRVNDIQTDDNSMITAINGIQWEQADIRAPGFTSKKNVSTSLTITDIRGNNTRLSAPGDKQSIHAFFETFSADGISLAPGKPLQIINPSAKGREFSLDKGNTILTAGRFRLTNNNTSALETVAYHKVTARDSVSLVTPAVEFVADINAIIGGAIRADEITMSHPRIHIIPQPADYEDPGKGKSLPGLSIGKISLLQPDLILEQPGSSGFTRVEWHSNQKKVNSLEITGFKTKNGSEISADQLLFSLNDFLLASGNKTFRSGEGEIKATINGFHIKSNDLGGWDWQGNIKDLKAQSFSLSGIGKNAGKLDIGSAVLNNLSISSATILNLRQLVKENAGFRLEGFTGNYENAKDHFGWKNAGYNREEKKIFIDSFVYHPVLPKNEFLKNQQFQTDYTALQTGAIHVDNFSTSGYLTDSVLRAGTITITHAMLNDYRDKRMPFRHGITKPLPMAMLKKIPARLNIGLIDIQRADITYTEVNDKTNEAGTVRLNRISARVSAINNYDSKAGDSLDIKAQGYLADSFRISLLFRQSATDPQAGFLMRATLGPGDARILNPVIMPLASVKIYSGIHDSLNIQATGNDKITRGMMQMIYHHLKIKLLNNTTADSLKGPSKRFASFLANTFVVRDKNRSRTVAVHFERNTERSVFHYLWKTMLSGITRSIGLKKIPTAKK